MLTFLQLPKLEKSCHSKNLIYLIECKKCHLQYIGEALKRQLNERFREHRRSILNHQQLSTTTLKYVQNHRLRGHLVR